MKRTSRPARSASCAAVSCSCPRSPKWANLMPDWFHRTMLLGPRVAPPVLSWKPGMTMKFSPAAAISWRDVTGRPSMRVKAPPTPAEKLWSVWLCEMVTAFAVTAGMVYPTLATGGSVTTVGPLSDFRMKQDCPTQVSVIPVSCANAAPAHIASTQINRLTYHPFATVYPGRAGWRRVSGRAAVRNLTGKRASCARHVLLRTV